MQHIFDETVGKQVVYFIAVPHKKHAEKIDMFVWCVWTIFNHFTQQQQQQMYAMPLFGEKTVFSVVFTLFALVPKVNYIYNAINLILRRWHNTKPTQL